MDIGPDTPSAEGPAVTAAAATFDDLHTYAPLRPQLECGWGPPCPPGSPLQVQFNNLVDPATIDTAKVLVDPPIEGIVVTASNGGIWIEGTTEARTTYTVTVPAGITDVFGQTLGKDEHPSVTTGAAQPSISQPPAITTLDPFTDGKRLPIVTVNQPKLRVRTFAAEPSMFAEYLTYLRSRFEQGSKVPDWQVLSDRMIVAGRRRRPSLRDGDRPGRPARERARSGDRARRAGARR